MSSLCVYGDSGGGMACFRSIVRTERDWGGMTSLDFFFGAGILVVRGGET